MIQYVDRLQQEAWTAQHTIQLLDSLMWLIAWTCMSDIYRQIYSFVVLYSTMLSVYWLNSVNGRKNDDWWVRIDVEGVAGLRKTTKNVRPAGIPVGIWTGCLPSVGAIPTCLVDRDWIQCSQKYEFCKCSWHSLLSSPGSYEAPECPFIVPCWNVVTLFREGTGS